MLDSRRIAFGALALLVVVFLAQAWPRIDAPFGDSHDGQNGATWGLASRAIRDSGIVESRAGARLAGDEGTYAHHPPLIALETAAAETVGGVHPWSTRAPAWLGSLASIVLLYVLLREHGLRRVSSALGVVVAFASPMFFLYGSMLDTLQIGLPFALALLVVRARRDRRGHSHGWAVGLLAGLTVVASWEGALLCACLAVADVARAWRRERRVRMSPTMIGWAVGLAATGAYLVGSSGSFATILDQLRERSGTGSSHSGWFDFVESQEQYLGALLSPVVVVAAVPGCIVAWRDRRTRMPLGVTLGVAVGYAVLLRDGATSHDYWNYWLLVPLAVSIAALCEWAVARARRLAIGLAVALSAVSLITAFPSGTAAARQFDYGLVAAHLVQRVERLHPATWYLAGPYKRSDTRWITYSTARVPVPLRSQRAAERARPLRPEALVLVRCLRPPRWLTQPCAEQAPRPYALMTTASFTRLTR